jgi:aldehyde dehydrogenase (NAD+)
MTSTHSASPTPGFQDTQATGSDATDIATSVVARVRAGFDRGITRPLAWRRGQLDALETLLRDNEAQLSEALWSDLHKSATEAWTTEIGFVLSDIANQRSNLAKWTAPTSARLSLMFRPGKAQIIAEPKGVVLVLAPWNYPLQLVLSPMAAVITAGDAVVAKPSELAPATSAAIIELAARYLDPDAIAVVGGGIAEASALLEQKFDHIFFTGSTTIGRVVMRAAAEHLTPVTLELGGKSPAIVAADAAIEVTARRIAWGKFLNAGQTCVAPDYVLVAREQRDHLVEHLRVAIAEFYGDDPQTSADYGRIVNHQHFARLQALIDRPGSGSIAVGGSSDPSERYIAPTVLIDVEPDSNIMADEIFGPILPIIAIDTVDEALEFVNARPKPLALYVFSNDDHNVEETLRRTSSGGVAVNATVLHLGPPGLPFGGIGPSGMGAYHGRAGFETFSHMKSVYSRRTWPDLKIIYPPYTKLKSRLLRRAQ